MDWRERVAEGLPAPRDDEPASLRQDILDELADHLDCALKRELSKNITPDEAVEKVKRRFGDPRDLARRLWLDAMKDTIMSKRLTLVAMGLMFVMCLLLGWMVWTSQRASQEAAASIWQTNSELVNKLTALLAARPAPGGNLVAERFPVRLHLVCDDAKKSPARGYSGTLALQHGFLNALHKTSDGNGDLDFGMLPAGQYTITVSTPWDETSQFPFEVSPAFPSEFPVACPGQDWQSADTSLKFVGLPSLNDRDALIYCQISSDLNRRVGDRGWYWTHPDSSGGSRQGVEQFDVVLDPSGRIVYFDKGVSGQISQGAGTRYALAPHPGVSNNYFQLQTPTDQFSRLADGLKHSPRLHFCDRKYVIQSINVVLASDVRRQAGERVERDKLPRTLLTWEPGWTPFAGGSGFSAMNEQVTLHPVAGLKNVFEVQLSADFVDQVNKMLLSSASRIPESANATEAKTDAAAGAELLKTLGIEGAGADRTPGVLTGLRLKPVHDKSPAQQAGLKSDDLLLGVEGWNVNNDRELGWASRAYRPALHPFTGSRFNMRTNDFVRSRIPRASLLTLVLRGTQPLLFEIRPPGSPSPDSPVIDNDQPAVTFPVPSPSSRAGFHSRRRAPGP
jgi:hypothetical protein